jgi:hypothetical protein
LVQKILKSKSFKNPLDVLRYISAHEVAHYVHEISTHPPYSHEKGTSFHGNASAYQDGFTLFVNSLNDAERKEFYHGNSNSKVNQDFEQFRMLGTIKSYRAHAEVDMIATVKLKQSGFTSWKDVIQFLENYIDEEKLLAPEEQSILDFENRKRAILKTLKEYK